MAPEIFRDWIGRTVTRRDVVTERIVEQFKATLSPHLFNAPCPPGLHWCLAVPAHPPENLGPDGAEKKGLFIPPIDLPLRRWWGGELQIHGALRIGDEVERVSRIMEVSSPPRSESQLIRAAMEHEFSVRGEVVIREMQTLVFLAGASRGKTPDLVTDEQIAGHDLHWKVPVDETMLMRFSAVTFNGHRIHYDKAFASSEGQPGLLVHGPLQAALLLNQFAQLRGGIPRQFSYQCLSPLVAPQTAQVATRFLASSAQGMVVAENGIITTRGTASWT